MEYYTWKEREEEGIVMYRACYHGTKWKLESCPKVARSLRDEVEWKTTEFTEETWRALRELLWRKYQRKRCPWEMIERIDKILNPD